MKWVLRHNNRNNGIPAAGATPSTLREAQPSDTLERMNSDDEMAELKILYPNLSPEELVIAKENLDRYLTLAWEIFEDAQMESREHDPDTFSPFASRGKIEAKVDSP